MGARAALAHHWPEYLMEGALLGIFMIAAGTATTLFEANGTRLHSIIPDPDVRRALIGLAMGLTAVLLIYSPWGQQSGAHMNPAVTLTFLRLGKVKPWDATFYLVAQFVGGLTGVVLVSSAFGDAFRLPPVSWIVTVPGPAGVAIAFAAELLISFVLMLVVLVATNGRLARWTGLFAGLLVASYITFEAPYSGMSINPARSFASAFPSGLWTAVWIYFAAPVLGMLLAAEAFATVAGRRTRCAKLNHHTHRRCIFRCGYAVADVSPGEPS